MAEGSLIQPFLNTHSRLCRFRKDEVLMVGDNLMTDILGANRAGIKTVWINRHDKVRNEVVPSYEITHLEELFPLLEELKTN